MTKTRQDWMQIAETLDLEGDERLPDRLLHQKIGFADAMAGPEVVELDIDLTDAEVAIVAGANGVPASFAQPTAQSSRRGSR